MWGAFGVVCVGNGCVVSVVVAAVVVAGVTGVVVGVFVCWEWGSALWAVMPVGMGWCPALVVAWDLFSRDR